MARVYTCPLVDCRHEVSRSWLQFERMHGANRVASQATRHDGEQKKRANLVRHLSGPRSICCHITTTKNKLYKEKRQCEGGIAHSLL